jgi:cytochrome d ubiquinol oxidase subunit II
MLPNLWFCVVAAMIAVYVVLDGFDLGAGILHLLVARTDAERRAVLASIGPVWDANEVWLLAGGGTLYFAFPALYASSFSGFYLPLMMVLWLLILRGISIEFRNHLHSAVWEPFWDAGFSLSSALLAVFFGAALANVVRGVPLDAKGDFFLPLWTDFRTGQAGQNAAGILDWYTVLVGVAALAMLAQHGALWLALKTAGEVERRATVWANRLWWAVAAAAVAITIASFGVQPLLKISFAERPWTLVFPAVGLSGLVASRWASAGLRRFLGSTAFIAGLLTSAAAGIYPCVLPANSDPKLSLTVLNAAAGSYGLGVGLAWFIPGILLATAYFVYTYRSFAGKVRGS